MSEKCAVCTCCSVWSPSCALCRGEGCEKCHGKGKYAIKICIGGCKDGGTHNAAWWWCEVPEYDD